MSYELRDYQKEAVNQAVRHLKKYNQPFIVQAATGAGKSLIIAKICHVLDEPVLVLQPSKELLEQNYAKLQSYDVEDIAIYSASKNRKEVGKFTYATIGSIYKKPELFKHFRYVIIDECFVAGTEVDGRPIESLKPGDHVRSFNHETNQVEYQRVLNVQKRPVKQKLYCIGLNGESIISTANHPYYVTGKGYIAAKDLKPGDRTYAIEKEPDRDTAMHRVQTARHAQGLSPVLAIHKIWTRVSQGLCGQSGRPALVGADGKTQPNEQFSYATKNEYNPETHWPQTSNTGRQWSRAHTPTDKFIRIFRKRLVSRTDNTHKTNQALSSLLQNRRGESSSSNSSRNRWQQSLLSQGSRSTQNGLPRIAAVDSIAILEQGSDGRFSNGESYDYVYNLEVENNHNYFAEGVLVHNCHNVNPKGWGMYKTFLAAIGCRNVCGLTATPYRIVQRYVTYNQATYYTATLRVVNRIHPFFFRKIVFKIETQDLIDQGYLAPIKYHVGRVDLSKLVVNSTGADFTEQSLAEWGNARVAEIVAVTEFSAKNAKRTLVFCTSIRQAESCLSLFRSRETPPNVEDDKRDGDEAKTSPSLSSASLAAIVTGTTPAKEREQIVADFRAGRVRVLFNVGVFTTGFDVPELNSIILARPTMSLALYYQMVGRGVRLDPADASKELRVFDLAGVSSNMGRVETIRLAKEADGFRDTVVSEVGRMDETPLFSFKLKEEPAWQPK